MIGENVLFRDSSSLTFVELSQDVFYHLYPYIWVRLMELQPREARGGVLPLLTSLLSNGTFKDVYPILEVKG